MVMHVISSSDLVFPSSFVNRQVIGQGFAGKLVVGKIWPRVDNESLVYNPYLPWLHVEETHVLTTEERSLARAQQYRGVPWPGGEMAGAEVVLIYPCPGQNRDFQAKPSQSTGTACTQKSPVYAELKFIAFDRKGLCLDWSQRKVINFPP